MLSGWGAVIDRPILAWLERRMQPLGTGGVLITSASGVVVLGLID